MIRFMVISILLTLTYPAYGQQSLINSVLSHQDAIVEVTAVRFGQQKKGKIATFTSRGAGVIIDPAGIVVTNLHTVKFADKIGVKLSNGQLIGGRIIKLMPNEDLVLVRIRAPVKLNAIGFADSNRLHLGQEVVHIGASYYLKGTISGGRITGLGRSQSTNELGIIQVNLDVYEGDSGGPLLNRRGELIGMINAKRMNENKVSYAIPSNKIKKLFLQTLK